MASMTDIAAVAGVSLATVGRVLHHNGYVSEDAKKRVEEAVKTLGYVPNTMARALKSRKSGLIGSFVVDNPNGLYRRINESLTDAAEKAGMSLITLQGRLLHRDEGLIVDRFIGMQVDGLVIISNGNMTADLFEKLHTLKIPVVCVERCYDYPFVDNLIVRDRAACRDGLMRMLEEGHRSLALLAIQPVGVPPSSEKAPQAVEWERMSGLMEALEQYGLSPEQVILPLHSYSVEEGYRAMKRALMRTPRPTGVFCTADTLAAGALQAIYQAGLRVPDDISIVGYDDIIAGILSPPIDSVGLDLSDAGKTILSMLSDRMKDPELPPQTAYLNTCYHDRKTVAASR